MLFGTKLHQATADRPSGNTNSSNWFDHTKTPADIPVEVFVLTVSSRGCGERNTLQKVETQPPTFKPSTRKNDRDPKTGTKRNKDLELDFEKPYRQQKML